MVSECFLIEAGEQEIDWVLKNTEQHGNGMPKIDNGDAKNMADKSTEITIFLFGKHWPLIYRLVV